MTEAQLKETDEGWLAPDGDGWYVLNAKDAKWLSNEMGWYCNFEGDTGFPEFGLNLNRLPPGAPMAMYHHEPHQEGFLVLEGEAILIVGGEEHRLKRWDYVHLPATVPHVIVGAGDGALVLAAGSRVGGGGATYPRRRGGRALRRECRDRDERAAGGLRPLQLAGAVAVSRRASARMSGWHIVNARDVQWFDAGGFGFYADFEQGEQFGEFGFNIGMGLPGQPGALYHRESHQEGFLVLSGEGLLIVEGQERPLRRWDYFHCPAGVEHIIVGAGDGPLVIVAVGGRVGPGESRLSGQSRRAEARRRRRDRAGLPKEAYAAFPSRSRCPFARTSCRANEVT